MISIRTLTAAAGIALTVATPAAAATSPLCTQLKKIVASASETPSFGSLSKGGPAGKVGTLVPTGLSGCTISRFSSAAIADAYSCRGQEKQTEAALMTQLERLNGEVTACFGVSPVKPNMLNNRGYNHMDFFVNTPKGQVIIYTLTPYITTEYRNIGLAVSIKRPG